MKQYVCSVCGYIYDEAAGIPTAGIPAGTRWEDLPENWTCPLGRAGKSAVRLKEEKQETAVPPKAPELRAERSPMEMSIICSNLARGCEKQYLGAEAKAFRQLADFFRGRAEEAPGDLAALVKEDLETGFPYAREAAKEDRGALRSLVWSEKVTRMLQSLLARYGEKEPAENVWVCSVCGFIYVGENPPELCPVCRVPAWKFEKIGGRE